MEIFLIILAIVSLAVIIWIVVRHFSELRMLNVETIPKERDRQIKAAILAKRLGRFGQAQLKHLQRGLAPVQVIGRRIKKQLQGRIKELEIAYLEAKRKTMISRGKRTAQIVGLLREAEEFVNAGKLEEAEQKYVSVAALDPRNVDAYEGLGNLYLKTKKFAEAREALGFILKFRPNDASVLASMGELAAAEEKNEEAVDYFKRAVNLRPGNPKYLDFLIETAILAKNKIEAERGLSLIREANPENAKIGEWESQISEL